MLSSGTEPRVGQGKHRRLEPELTVPSFLPSLQRVSTAQNRSDEAVKTSRKLSKLSQLPVAGAASRARGLLYLTLLPLGVHRLLSSRKSVRSLVH